MSSQQSKALTKRPASGSLMAPPPAPKRIKRPTTVLDEDTYTSAIAYIIRRDYFPGLAETEAQREYMNALDSKDNSWIREAGKKLTQVMTPMPAGHRRKAPNATPLRSARGGSETPKVWAGDTPLTTTGTELADEEEAEADKKPDVDLNLSLSAFQAKYTSEDQESFSQIIDRQNEKKFANNAWIRNGNRFASKQRLAQQKVIEANSHNNSQHSTDLTLRPSQNQDDRPAAPKTTKHTPFNALMFNPDSVESWTATRAQAAETTSLAPPKTVVHRNTRLAAPADEPARPPSPTLSTVRDAIAGNPRRTQSEIVFAGGETPRVNGYAFVDAVGPSEDDEDPAPTDLLEKFNRYNTNGNSGPSPFTIHDPERREKLHHKMVERIGEKARAGNVDSMKPPSGLGWLGGKDITTTPRFLSAPTPRRGDMTPGPGKRHVGNLTPAGRILAGKVGVGVGVGRRMMEGGFEGGEEGREWTPTPRVKRRF
jgi:protein DGCR14